MSLDVVAVVVFVVPFLAMLFVGLCVFADVLQLNCDPMVFARV